MFFLIYHLYSSFIDALTLFSHAAAVSGLGFDPCVVSKKVIPIAGVICCIEEIVRHDGLHVCPEPCGVGLGQVDRLEDYESDPLGKMIQEIQSLQVKKNCVLFSPEEFEALNTIRQSRNFWVHQCFVGYSHVTFRNGIVRAPYGEKLATDLNEAIDWDQKIIEVKHSIDQSVPTIY